MKQDRGICVSLSISLLVSLSVQKNHSNWSFRQFITPTHDFHNLHVNSALASYPGHLRTAWVRG